MVRVLTVHNFTNQHIQTIEQPTASTVAPPNRLLIALSNHSIEVRDLNDEGKILFNFPTVDRVVQMIHCLNGNYVATMETKCNRQNRDFNYVRVYVNWDNIATLQQSKMSSTGASLDSTECGMVQPMRARIAGKVTPSTNQTELSNLEMIEIPLQQNPSLIDCCQISGNILIQLNKSLVIYVFHIKTHDISKLRFIDFEEFPVYIQISFVPSKIAFCENYIACLNKDSMHMFKIVCKEHKNIGATKLVSDDNFKFNKTINYKEVLKEEMKKKFEDKITVNLPSIVKSNSVIRKHSPFTYTDKDMSATIKYNFFNEDKSHHFEVSHLIQLKLKPIIIENSQTQVLEEFKCLTVKPIYTESGLNKNETSYGCELIKSDYRKLLAEVVCVITTLQEGYLFQFYDNENDVNVDNCISVYPFMGPVQDIALEGHLIHAITETGLESYTTRIGHKLCKDLEFIDGITNSCPPISQLLCLIGHRQFIGVEQILLDDNHLVLLANGDVSPTHSVGSNSSSTTSLWTLYSLELPSPKIIFNDIAIAANAHRFSASQTYCHLMSEAHMILRLNLHMLKWKFIDGSICTVTVCKQTANDLVESYRKSCALLGDHFLMSQFSNDYVLCLPYYQMASVTSFQVVKRFNQLKKESNIEYFKGIIYYLQTVLLESKLFMSDTTATTEVCKQNFIDEILEIFGSYGFKDLSHLILKNRILREYSTCKLINILLNQSNSDAHKETERLLALALLYVQECNTNAAEKVISCINNHNSLYGLLVDNWKLLFECSTTSVLKHKSSYSFTEFSVILMFSHRNTLANVFVSLMLDHKVSLHTMLWMFLEYLPSRLGLDYNKASTVMQVTLEEFFKIYFADHDKIKDGSVEEAIIILARSYMSQLQVFNLKESNISTNETNNNGDPSSSIKGSFEESETKHEVDNSKNIQHNFFSSERLEHPNSNSPFYNFRYKYLDKMPPFQVEVTSKLYEMCLDKPYSKETCTQNTMADEILQKLQALLCSRIVSNELKKEVETFLTLNENMRGYMSLNSILLTTNEAVGFLLDTCPQCLLQYGKDKFTENDEWKFLIHSIQNKIMSISEDHLLQRVCFFYKKLLKDVLTHLATTLNVECFMEVLPLQSDTLNEDDHTVNEIFCYDTYINISKKTMQANQIKKLIMTTGQQLLYTLSL